MDLMIIRNGTELEYVQWKHIQHKMAAFHSMAHRLTTVPLTQTRYRIERDYIIELGNINGCKHEMIERIIRKHEQKATLTEATSLSQSRDKEKTKRVNVPFDPWVCKSMAKVFIEVRRRNSGTLG